jgi:hypothetical protein
MALNASLEVSFQNKEDWKGMRQKAEVDSTKVYITNGQTPR